MEVSPAGRSQLTVKFCQPQPTPSQWQKCQGISLLQLSLPPCLEVTATHQPCHRPVVLVPVPPSHSHSQWCAVPEISGHNSVPCATFRGYFNEQGVGVF